jgi:hypothetical protein
MLESAPPRSDRLASPEHEDELEAHDDELEAPAVAPPPRPPVLSRRTFGAVALILVVVGGIAYRFWLALGPLGRAPTSDETVVGLMALRLWRHHELYTFYWRQSYGGTLQTWLMAPIVGVFGPSISSLRLVTTLEGIAAPIITWRIARHLFKPRVALLAGVVALWWPLSLAYFSTQERLFYALTVVLGLLAVLSAVNIDEKPGLLRHWIVLGLCVGTGWWESPNIVYYALPIVIYLLVRGHWRHWRGIATASVAFLFSSAAWTYTNIFSGFHSLQSPDWAAHSTYWSRLGFFFRMGLPFSLGLRHTGNGRWFWGASTGRFLYVAGILIVGVSLVLAIRRIRSRASIIVFLVALAPLIYAYFPPTWRLVEGRYLYFVASLLPLLVCEVMQFRAGQVVVLGFVAIAAVAFIRDYGTHPLDSRMTPLARVLDQNGYDTAVADYWIAYDLTYATDERIIASPLRGQVGARYQPYINEIERSKPAYVFFDRQTTQSEKVRRALERANIGYRVVEVSPFTVVLPEKPFIIVP